MLYIVISCSKEPDLNRAAESPISERVFVEEEAGRHQRPYTGQRNLTVPLLERLQISIVIVGHLVNGWDHVNKESLVYVVAP